MPGPPLQEPGGRIPAQGTALPHAWGQRTGATPGEGQHLPQNLSLVEPSLEEVPEGHGEAGLEPAGTEGRPRGAGSRYCKGEHRNVARTVVMDAGLPRGVA